MNRSQIRIIPEYFQRYVELIPANMELIDALTTYGIDYIGKEILSYEALGNQVYKHGKWTIKEILTHLIDTERIFAYRALRFARGDQKALAGMDQDDYVTESNASLRSIDELYEEFKAVRESSICLFKSIDEEKLNRYGKASGMDVSVLALGFMICGHVIHHQEIIEEYYYPLLTHQ